MQPIHVQDLKRVQRIAAVAARHGFGEVFANLGLTTASNDAEHLTAPYARRVRQALVELGPTFVKLGQVLSQRPDILPRDLLTELSTLTHDVEPMPESEVRKLLEEELPVPMDEVFTEFDFKPLGAASIAQVHGATLATGERVAVKLQRRGIEPVIRSDLHILYSVAHLLEGRVSIPGLYTPTAIVREFDAAIRRELDFLQEAAATRRMAQVLEDTDVIVPKVLPRWSSRRIMIMERIDGQPLSMAIEGMPLEQRRAIAHQLMDSAYRQVFEHGFFHGDPHPGNLFVTNEGKLALLDFGITGLLTASMQDTILSTFTAMVFRDPDTLATTIYRAGATHDRVDLREFRDALELKMVTYYGATLDELAQRDTLLEVVEMAIRFRIDLPSEFAVLARALTLIEGNIRRLLPDVDIVAEVRPYAERLMAHRFSPERLARDAASLLFRLQAQARDLPTQASQVLMDLDAGRLTLVTRDPDAARQREELRDASTRLALAIVFGSATVAGAIATSSGPGLSTLLLGLGALTFLLLLVSVLAPGSLDLGVWRRRIWRTWRFFVPPTSETGSGQPSEPSRSPDAAR